MGTKMGTITFCLWHNVGGRPPKGATTKEQGTT